MVAPKGLRFARLGFLAVLLGASLTAESVTTIGLDTFAGVAGSPGETPTVTGLTEVELGYRSEGSREVKGELILKGEVSEAARLDVYRAYIKTRFPGFRLTAGKTRLAWGEGFMFNAGDVLFDSVSTAVDLTGDELRTEGKWLAAVYLPLDRFSYVELVFLPPQYDPFEYAVDARLAESGYGEDTAPPDGDETAGGGRLVLKPGGIKLEAGYFFSGADVTYDAVHRPYLSLQGNLYLDWQLSASSAVEAESPAAEDLYRNSAVSFGLSHLIRAGYSTKLQLRLEGLLRPDGEWRESEQVRSDETEYGLYLYPEISVTPDDRRSFFYRAVVSPVDVSALHTLGASWNIYQDFTLSGYAGIATGERSDRFPLDPGSSADAGGYFLSLGCEFLF